MCSFFCTWVLAVAWGSREPQWALPMRAGTPVLPSKLANGQKVWFRERSWSLVPWTSAPAQPREVVAQFPSGEPLGIGRHAGRSGGARAATSSCSSSLAAIRGE